jgi:hypothetical protein
MSGKHDLSGLTANGTAKCSGDSPLAECEVVGVGFYATRRDVILLGFRRESYFVNCFQRDW